MMSYVEALQRLPEEWRLPMVEFADAMEIRLRNQLAVRRQDIDELREAVRDLARAQERTAAAQARTEQRVGRLEEAVANLSAAQARTEAALTALTLKVDDLVTVQLEMRVDIGRLKGRVLEREYADKAPAVFGGWLRRVRVLLPGGGFDAATEDRLFARLTDAERQDLLRLDVAVRGRLARAAEQPVVYLAIEVSGVIDSGDVERAQRRAGLLRKAGLAAVPVVAGEDVTEGAATMLRDAPVALTLNGHCEGWEKALAAAIPSLAQAGAA